jgi:hypothetical protein
MDHCIRFSWENKDFENHLGYLFYNSWKHLHIGPKDFPYHNFDSMVKRGWLHEDIIDFPESEFHFEIYE